MLWIILFVVFTVWFAIRNCDDLELGFGINCHTAMSFV